MKTFIEWTLSTIVAFVAIIGLYVVVSFGYTMFLMNETKTQYQKDMESCNFITEIITQYKYSNTVEELERNKFDILNLRSLLTNKELG